MLLCIFIISISSFDSFEKVSALLRGELCYDIWIRKWQLSVMGKDAHALIVILCKRNNFIPPVEIEKKNTSLGYVGFHDVPVHIDHIFLWSDEAGVFHTGRVLSP